MASQPENEFLLVVPSQVEEAVSGAKFLKRGSPASVRIDVNTIRDGLSRFLSSIQSLAADLPELAAPYSVDEIHITVEVNAEGRIQLVGGVSAGAGGGITLMLKRSPP